jgi:hypothetical protein
MGAVTLASGIERVIAIMCNITGLGAGIARLILTGSFFEKLAIPYGK